MYDTIYIYGQFHAKVPQAKFMKYVKWHQNLIKLVNNSLYFNAQTNFIYWDDICHEKNEVKVT